MYAYDDICHRRGTSLKPVERNNANDNRSKNDGHPWMPAV